jgi:hypothetical protein
LAFLRKIGVYRENRRFSQIGVFREKYFKIGIFAKIGVFRKKHLTKISVFAKIAFFAKIGVFFEKYF